MPAPAACPPFALELPTGRLAVTHGLTNMVMKGDGGPKMEPRAVEHMLPGVVQEALSRIGLLLDTLFETAEDAVFLMDGIRFID